MVNSLSTPHALTRFFRPAAGRRVLRLLIIAVVVAGLWSVVGPAGTSRAQSPAAAPSGGIAGAEGDSESLTAADRDLLVKVRLAGLWETPAGRMAARKGVNPRVREIGSIIGSQHVQLDAFVVQAAREVSVTLPDEPNADQKQWLGEMEAATGEQFDHVFVDRLRAAHGKVFPVIAAVRSGTRNTVVRQLAQRANGFVLTHLTLLESTGLVDYSALPVPAAATSTTGSAPSTGWSGAMGSAIRSLPGNGLGLVLPIMVVPFLPWFLRLLRRDRTGDDEQDRRPPPPVPRRERAMSPPSPYSDPCPDHRPDPGPRFPPRGRL